MESSERVTAVPWCYLSANMTQCLLILFSALCLMYTKAVIISPPPTRAESKCVLHNWVTQANWKPLVILITWSGLHEIQLSFRKRVQWTRISGWVLGSFLISQKTSSVLLAESDLKEWLVLVIFIYIITLNKKAKFCKMNPPFPLLTVILNSERCPIEIIVSSKLNTHIHVHTQVYTLTHTHT